MRCHFCNEELEQSYKDQNGLECKNSYALGYPHFEIIFLDEEKTKPIETIKRFFVDDLIYSIVETETKYFLYCFSIDFYTISSRGLWSYPADETFWNMDKEEFIKKINTIMLLK